ncbi:MAG: tagaturonate epimerase family protein [Kiritimatiellaeota bacterium]|nr:tagaturonate epimerase family protein [Kiritimatiellota bacterium]
MLKLEKYSAGVGDRFAMQAEAQLHACIRARESGAEIVPVWNKSNREHLIVGSEPTSVRTAAAAAVQALAWRQPWHVDADHIRLETVDRFIPPSDFFTIDVADSIGKPAAPEAVQAFVVRHAELAREIRLPGGAKPMLGTAAEVGRLASKHLFAVQEAARIYRHISAKKGEANFITEVSIDETDAPQTPLELLVILAALADEKVPVQTIAPKFTGRFNKGVDYVGDAAKFEQEFNDDISVIQFVIATYGLPVNLKLSVHSGSDKFSIYPAIHRALKRHNAGVHLKTAGTSWLEEVIGLAESGGAGLALAKAIYAEALAHADELCAPYATVIDIDRARLPAATTVAGWTGEQFANALRHEPHCREFNPSLRQLIHVGYKVAAHKRKEYLDLVEANREIIARNVTGNLFDRHFKPIFLGG